MKKNRSHPHRLTLNAIQLGVLQQALSTHLQSFESSAFVTSEYLVALTLQQRVMKIQLSADSLGQGGSNG